MSKSGQKHDPLDPQREQVYEAESDVWPAEEADMLTLEELRWQLEEIQGSAWFKKAFPRAKRIPLMDGRGDQYSRGGPDGIHLIKRSRHIDVLIHEVAHVVAPVGVEWHGSLYCGIELYIVGKYFGSKTKVELRRAFRRRGVRHDPRVARYGRVA